MLAPRRLAALLWILVLLAACERTPEAEAPAAVPELVAAPEPEGPPVYTWYDEAGVPRLAERIEDIPEEARSRVVVSRLGAGPESGLAGSLTVGDFREAEKPAFSEVDLKKLAAGAPALGAALLAHDRVLVYSTPWCGYCKKVMAHLKERGVAFEERDIEASPRAASELKAKLAAAGIAFGGVPVTDVRGQLVVGFDRAKLDLLLDGTGKDDAPDQDG